jgi:hypothetical protein
LVNWSKQELFLRHLIPFNIIQPNHCKFQFLKHMRCFQHLIMLIMCFCLQFFHLSRLCIQQVFLQWQLIQHSLIKLIFRNQRTQNSNYLLSPRIKLLIHSLLLWVHYLHLPCYFLSHWKQLQFILRSLNWRSFIQWQFQEGL